MSAWASFPALAATEVSSGLLADLAWLTLASALVYLTVRVVGSWIPRRAATLRHALWALVILRLLLPWDLTSPWSLWRSWAVDGASPDLSPALVLVTGPHPPIPFSRGVESGSLGGAWTVLMVGIWLIGALATIARFLRRRQPWSSLASRPALTAGPAFEELQSWRRRWRIRRPIRLVSGPEDVLPFTVGLFRPSIVVPTGLVERGTSKVLTAVLAHELAHVRRLDELWIWLQCLARALFFFHPVVRWTERRMATEAELACDQLVLASRVLTPRQYGEALLQVMQGRLREPEAVAALRPERNLTMRIRHIAETRKPRAVRPLWAGPLLFAAVGLVLLPPSTTSGIPALPLVLPPAVASGSGGAVSLPTPASFALEGVMPGARMTSGFGPRRHPVSRDMLHHDGVDLSLGEEAPVYAPRGGVVEMVAENYGSSGAYGTVVLLDHGGGIKTFYAHLARGTVTQGSGVRTGDQIGVAGETGVAFGPHLHFELWKDGEKVDPQHWEQILGDG